MNMYNVTETLVSKTEFFVFLPVRKSEIKDILLSCIHHLFNEKEISNLRNQDFSVYQFHPSTTAVEYSA